MENNTQTHVNLIDDDEKDPLELDIPSSRSSTEDAKCGVSTNLKHSHGLRRHVPRIIVKPILPDKKTFTTISSLTSPISTTTTAVAVSTINVSSTVNTLSNRSPTSRGNGSRRLQQQQRTKASIGATAAIGNMTVDSTVATQVTTAITQASTMREVLASIPGFSLKPRRRSSKKISTAAQIEQTKDGKIDLETPDSILSSTNLRALLNKQTFSMLPPLYQYNLIQLLPSVDRETVEMEHRHLPNTIPSEAIRLGPSSLNNEFFARACLEWRERLAEGEFTPENQIKLKTEAEREKNKLDPWKLKHFEPIWGEKTKSQASSSNDNDTVTLKTICTKNSAVSNSMTTTTMSSAVQPNTSTTSLTNSTTTKTISASTPCLHIANSPLTNNATKSYNATFFNFSTIADTQSTSTSIISDRNNFTINYVKNETSLNNVANNNILQQNSAKLIVVPQTITSPECIIKPDITKTTFSQDVNILKEITQNKEHQSSSFVVLTTINPSKTSDILKRGTKRTSSSESNQQVIQDAIQGKHFKVEFKPPALQTDKKSFDDRSECRDLYTTNHTECSLPEKHPHNIDSPSESMSKDKEHEVKNHGFNVSFETITENVSVDHEICPSVNHTEGNVLPSDLSHTKSTCNIPQAEFNALECENTIIHSPEPSQNNVNHNDYSHKEGIAVDPTIHLTNNNANNVQTEESDNASKNEDNDVPCDIGGLVEQTFTDAQNYVLESVEISSDDNAGTKFKDSTNNHTANTGTQTKTFTNEANNILNNSLKIASSIPPPTLLSTISCSTSGFSSINLAEMKAIISSVACLTAAQPETLDRNTQTIATTQNARRNEIFHHLEHDWNFGDIKIQHPSTSNFSNLLQSQGVVIKLNNLKVDNNEKNSDSVTETNCFSDQAENRDENPAQQVMDSLLDDGDLVMNIEDDRSLNCSNTVKMLVDDLQHQQLIHVQQQNHHVTGAVVQTLPIDSATYMHKSSAPLQHIQDMSSQEHKQQPLTDYNRELPSEIMCEVPITGAEMVVSNTALRNSNSNDSNNGLIKSLSNSDSGSRNLNGNIKAPDTALAHIHQQQISSQILSGSSNETLQNTPHQSQQQQRQILLDSNGQIIGNFLIQQQQYHEHQRRIQNQQQLLHQQLAFHTPHHTPAADKQQPTPNKLLPDLSRQIYELQANVEHFLGETETLQTPTTPVTVNPIQSISHTEITHQLYHQYASDSHPQSHSVQHTPRNFLINHTASSCTNPAVAAPQNLLASHRGQQQQLQLQQQLLQQQQQQHQLSTFSTVNKQQQQEPNTSFRISFPTRSAVSSKSSTIPSGAPPITAKQQQSLNTTFNNNNNSNINASVFNNSTNCTSSLGTATTNIIKTLPALSVSTSISQPRPVTVKVSSNKGRKTTSKLPPGAVNLERSYQICQAVIQNSPNRENLKAQLRPPSALLNQQQQNNMQSTVQLTNSTVANTTANSKMLKTAEGAIETANTNNVLSAGIPANISRPNVYKIIGPRMGFPRKKYVQRKSSPCLIRHVFANQSSATVLQTTKAKPTNASSQLTIVQQTTTPIRQDTTQHNLSHDVHHNGNGQYVLIHRANVGAADNHAPRASSAPPVPQNQNSLPGLTDTSITGRGRPASVDVDTFNRNLRDVRNSLHINNPNIPLIGRNLSTATGNVYIDALNGSPSNIVDNGNNYLVTRATTTALSNIRAMRPHNQKQSTSDISTTNSHQSNCACSLNAMIICQQCGAYCHDDCVNSLKLCGACVIR